MSKEIIWHPSKEQIRNSKLTKFIQHCNLKNYDELEKKSFSDPGWLWDNVIKFADLKFFKPVEPYKQKGITSNDQFVLKKEGKKK